MSTALRHWAEVLRLRDEIVATGGQIADLQMSLYSAVYTDRDVPYQDPSYYSDITEPTPGLISFMGSVARRLGTGSAAGKALFHLDQGMGGGKSHALVGLYHLGKAPDAFLATELGVTVRDEAERSGTIDLAGSRVVVLSADNMTPGATSPEFGPATTLYERFLWSLFRGDKEAYQQHLAEGPNKAALARALESVGGPVLILLDELMDYVMLLSDQTHRETMPGEQAFLSNLMDAVDDIPQVAFVIVMIRSDFDDRGYTVEAENFRSYVATRIERNGTTIAVTEAQDFAAIIRRRLFDRCADAPASELAQAWRNGADEAWTQNVFDRLGASRSLVGFGDRLTASYPFHADLMALVRDDWSRHAGFQRVRSTVEIFARAAHYWMARHDEGDWAPQLIGVGDLALTAALDQILSSGLLHGNERVVQGFRQVAAADVVTRDGAQGRSRELDVLLAERGVESSQPHPALRMATALFCYSLVPRAQAKRGATKPELLASIYEPGVAFQGAEEVFNVLVSDDGLGALEVTDATGGGTPARYQLAVTQTLRMFFKQAKGSVSGEERDAYIWQRARDIAQANPGPFDDVIPVTRPDIDTAPLAQVFGDVDQNGQVRLVVLDPRRWTLLDGRDTPTRNDITELFGLGPSALPVDNAASVVVSCVNTQRRDAVRRRATEALAWKAVVEQLEPDDEKRADAQHEFRETTNRVESELRKSFQHYVYLVRGADRIEIVWQRFDDDTKTALHGAQVWDALAAAGRATRLHQLGGRYLGTLLEKLSRDLTLKEVVQQFYKNPVFPLVSNTDDIRVAVFGLLSEGYELVDGNGERLRISNPDDLTIGAVDQTLRKQRGGADAPGGGEHAGPVPSPPVGSPTSPLAGEVTYRRYTLDVPNRSLVSDDARREVANLLQRLLDVIDPDVGGDVQLIDLRVDLTAAPDSVAELADRADAASAKWSEEDLDF
jgi:hypothetical protein